MYCNLKVQNLSEPKLQYFLNESKGYLHKRSTRTGTSLNHKDTYYTNDTAFIFLTKEDLINRTTFFQKSITQFVLADRQLKIKKWSHIFPFTLQLKKGVTRRIGEQGFWYHRQKVHIIHNQFQVSQYLSILDSSRRLWYPRKKISGNNTLGRTIFWNYRISLEIQNCLYLTITINIQLRGCSLWEEPTEQIKHLLSQIHPPIMWLHNVSLSERLSY